MSDRKIAEFTLEAFAQAEYYAWKADKEFQVAQNEADFLKEHGKDLLASLVTELEAEGDSKVSEAKLERLARSSEKWKTHQRGYFAASQQANLLRAKSRAAQRYFDCIQSGLAFKRSEMARTGAQSG